MNDQLKQVSFISTAYSNFKPPSTINDNNPAIIKRIQNIMHQTISEQDQNMDAHGTSRVAESSTFSPCKKRTIIKDLNRLTPVSLSSYRFKSVSTKNRLICPQALRLDHFKPIQQIKSPEIIHQQQKNNKKTYGTTWREYLQIFDFHNLVQPNSLDICAAELDLNFIKKKVEEVHQARCQTSLDQPIQQQKKLKTSYVDEDRVYWVEPNRIGRTKVTYKPQLKAQTNRKRNFTTL